MTEHGTVSQGQDRRHPSTPVAGSYTAHGVHTPVKGVQASCSAAFQDGVSTQASLLQLPARDRPVLATGDFRHQLISGAFVMHIPTKVPELPALPPHIGKPPSQGGIPG